MEDKSMEWGMEVWKGSGYREINIQKQCVCEWRETMSLPIPTASLVYIHISPVLLFTEYYTTVTLLLSRCTASTQLLTLTMT